MISILSPFRIGHGYDLHRLVSGAFIKLGGVEIKSLLTTAGHSDADVLLHAITDALCGALALGDIGSFFPDKDPANKGRASKDFLDFVVGEIGKRGYSISNIDATVILENPKIAPFREAIKSSIARICEISLDQVSVKGKTAEGLGIVGLQEACVCHAVVLLSKKNIADGSL